MDDPTLMHKHKCENCGIVWQHHFRARNQLRYHTCPGCGRVQWLIYQGDEPASVTQHSLRRKRWPGARVKKKVRR